MSWLADVRVPRCLLAAPFGDDELVRADLRIEAGKIAAIAPLGTAPPEAEQRDGGMVWPCPVELHTHLDKGHIWRRAPNLDGTFATARATVEADREANWSADDVRARMEFALECAHAHGTRAIRTHLDCIGKQTAISFAVFDDVRDAWRDRITLQAAALAPIDSYRDETEAEFLAATVARYRGVLGAFVYDVPDLDTLLRRIFGLATRHGLDCDFHVDETMDVGARTLPVIAATALAVGFAGRIVCGHCCSLTRQAPDEIDRTLDLVARAGITVVSLPMCNMYLMDRQARRTPRWRGVTLLHEMAARGIPVAVSSDNTRDPFYAYGDLDAVEVFREAVRIAQLDCPVGDWPRAITATPAQVMALPQTLIALGGVADLVLFGARFWDELLARPQADRVVLRAGGRVAVTLPDHRRLDRDPRSEWQGA